MGRVVVRGLCGGWSEAEYQTRGEGQQRKASFKSGNVSNESNESNVGNASHKG